MANTEQIREALRAVIDPELRQSIVDLGMVRSIEQPEPGRVDVVVSLTTPGCPIRSHFQNGVTEATRYGVTGQQMNDPLDPTTPLSRQDSIMRVMRDSSPGLTIADSEFRFCVVTDSTCVTPGTGGPDDIIKMTVTHPWRLISPMLWPLVGDGGVINLRVSVTMKNETYPTSTSG